MGAEPASQRSPGVRPLGSNEHVAAGNMLGRAFRDDPLWAATFADPEKLPELLGRMFTAVTKTTIAAGGRAETASDLRAAALWLPPERDFGVRAMVRSGFALPRFVLRMPARARRRMMAVLSQLGARKEAVMPEPCWHLVALGVDPEHQGEGLGSALLLSGMRRADVADTPIYLETETEDNVGFYQNFGFEVVDEITAVGVGVPVWLMARRPRAGQR